MIVYLVMREKRKRSKYKQLLIIRCYSRVWQIMLCDTTLKEMLFGCRSTWYLIQKRTLECDAIAQQRNSARHSKAASAKILCKRAWLKVVSRQISMVNIQSMMILSFLVRKIYQHIYPAWQSCSFHALIITGCSTNAGN